MNDIKPPPQFAGNDFEPTVQISREQLRDTGFGPLKEFGDSNESDLRTWTVIAALCMLFAWVCWGAYSCATAAL